MIYKIREFRESLRVNHSGQKVYMMLYTNSDVEVELKGFFFFPTFNGGDYNRSRSFTSL